MRAFDEVDWMSAFPHIFCFLRMLVLQSEHFDGLKSTESGPILY